MSETAAPLWRPMLAADVPAVMALSALVHPTFYERPEMFLNRIALYPAGGLVADGPAVTGPGEGWPGQGAEASLAAYAIAYPAPRLAPPPLDTVLGRLPPGADALYVHDVAVAPGRRGGGLAAAGIRRLLAVAEDFPAATLVSVYGTAPFWGRYGFEPANALIAPEKLASYGEGAVFMIRQTPGSEDRRGREASASKRASVRNGAGGG